MPRLVHVTTVPQSFGFVAGQVRYMTAHGFDVTLISSPSERLAAWSSQLAVPAYGVEMHRAITPVADLDAVARMTDILLDLDPDIVHAHTPKGGLVGMVSATLASVPTRVYHMRGLLTFTATGFRRRLLAAAEKTSCRLSHRVVCQSHSLRRTALDLGLTSARRSTVIRSGSNGVDAGGRFDPDAVSGDARTELGIPEHAPVIGFVGRLVRDKGIVELVDAWRMLRDAFEDAHLVVVGPFEERDAVDHDTRGTLVDDDRVHLVGFTRDTPKYYAAMDVLALPSYREGFPNVPLEAAAMRVPAVTTDVPGCVDAVVDGQTGKTVPVRDPHALAAALRDYLERPDLRRRHGEAARRRVLDEFRPEDIAAGMHALYLELLARRR